MSPERDQESCALCKRVKHKAMGETNGCRPLRMYLRLHGCLRISFPLFAMKKMSDFWRGVSENQEIAVPKLDLVGTGHIGAYAETCTARRPRPQTFALEIKSAESCTEVRHALRKSHIENVP